jgi:hypothetical protein
MPNPIVPMSIRSKSLFSSGRSTRSMKMPMSPVTASAMAIATPNGSLADSTNVDARYAPIITTLPCEKLTRPIVRNTSEKPMATSA